MSGLRHRYAGRLRRARQAGIAFEWRLEEGLADEFIPLHASYADLTITSPIDPDSLDVPGHRGLAVQLAMESGRPVLVIPFAEKIAALGQPILVAWTGSREAARALNDALPFLRRAELVSVLSINPSQSGYIAGFDISNQISRHGGKAEAVRIVSGDVSVSDLLLFEAADLGADMIVMGSYGNFRSREFILGASSRHILESMTVPMFVPH